MYNSSHFSVILKTSRIFARVMFMSRLRSGHLKLVKRRLNECAVCPVMAPD